MPAHDRARPPTRRPPAFTLVELLVVVGIVVVLVALLMPVLATTRAMSRRTACMSNARQTLVALNQYAIAHGDYPPNMREGAQLVFGLDDARPYWHAPHWDGAEGVPSHWRAYLIRAGLGDGSVFGCAGELPTDWLWRGRANNWVEDIDKLRASPPWYYLGPGVDVWRAADYYVGFGGGVWGGRAGRRFRTGKRHPLITDPWYYSTHHDADASGTFTPHTQRFSHRGSVPMSYDRTYDMNVGFTDGSVIYCSGAAGPWDYPRFFEYDWAQPP